MLHEGWIDQIGYKDRIQPLGNIHALLFEEFWKRSLEPWRYEYSWCFTIQYIQNMPHVYYDGENIFAFGIDHIQPSSITFISPMGVNVHEKAQLLAQALISHLHYKAVYVRYHNKKECDQFVSAGFKLRSYKYPQVIVDLSEIVNQKGGKWAKVRLRLNRFRGGLPHKCVDLNEQNYALAIEVCQAWRLSYLDRYGINASRPPIVTNFEWLVSQISQGAIATPCYSFVVIVGEPKGLCIATPVSVSCVAVYVNICDTKIDGLAEYLIYELAVRLKTLGFRTLNLGHSDIQNTHDFKLKFNPIQLAQTFSTIYE